MLIARGSRLTLTNLLGKKMTLFSQEISLTGLLKPTLTTRENAN